MPIASSSTVKPERSGSDARRGGTGSHPARTGRRSHHIAEPLMHRKITVMQASTSSAMLHQPKLPWCTATPTAMLFGQRRVIHKSGFGYDLAAVTIDVHRTFIAWPIDLAAHRGTADGVNAIRILRQVDAEPRAEAEFARHAIHCIEIDRCMPAVPGNSG